MLTGWQPVILLLVPASSSRVSLTLFSISGLTPFAIKRGTPRFTRQVLDLPGQRPVPAELVNDVTAAAVWADPAHPPGRQLHGSARWMKEEACSTLVVPAMPFGAGGLSIMQSP